MSDIQYRYLNHHKDYFFNFLSVCDAFTKMGRTEHVLGILCTSTARYTFSSPVADLLFRNDSATWSFWTVLFQVQHNSVEL